MEFNIITFSLLLSLLTLSEVQSHNNSHTQDMKSGESHCVCNPNNLDQYMNENCMDENSNKHKNMNLPAIKIHCTIEIPQKEKLDRCRHSNYLRSKVKYHDSTNFTYKKVNVTVSFDLYHSYCVKRGKFWCQMQTKEPLDVSNCHCGRKNEKKKDSTRIVGGVETGVNEYPMMAGLYNNKTKELYCGATIISPHHILTAAHCVDGIDVKNNISVVVGKHYVTPDNDTSATKKYCINNCIIHPNYKDIYNDIAVCKTVNRMQYNAEVGSVCLPFHHRCNSFINSNVTALGWGLLEFGGNKATALQKVNLKVTSLRQCQHHYKNYNLTNCHICTFTEGKDSCQMDSGGPLLWEDYKTHKLLEAGIISAGNGCASDSPAINTRVGCYVDWITCVTGEKFCKQE